MGLRSPGQVEAILVTAVEANVPEVVVAVIAIGDFQSMIRPKNVAKLDGWLKEANGRAAKLDRFAFCQRCREGHCRRS